MLSKICDIVRLLKLAQLAQMDGRGDCNEENDKCRPECTPMEKRLTPCLARIYRTHEPRRLVIVISLIPSKQGEWRLECGSAVNMFHDRQLNSQIP